MDVGAAKWGLRRKNQVGASEVPLAFSVLYTAYTAHPELCNSVDSGSTSLGSDSVGSIGPHLGLDRSEFRVRAARAARSSRPDIGARSNHPDIAA